MGRAAVVTGASRGIGAATAHLLAGKGYAVCVNYRNDEEAARRVVKTIEDNGGRALAVRANVSEPEEVRRMFEAVDNELGGLTALVNNAGIIGPRCRVEALDTAEFDRLMAVNVRGVVLCTQEAIRRMSTRHGGAGGAIVNVSSGAAYIGQPGFGVHYAVSKGAVNSFTVGLSQEVAGEGIRVNSVSPGLTRTDMVTAGDLEGVSSIIPMGRAGEPEEVAAAIAWLLSDEAAFVAGANVRVAGGRP